jgi:hypothetical protein
LERGEELRSITAAQDDLAQPLVQTIRNQRTLTTIEVARPRGSPFLVRGKLHQ